MPVTNRPLHFVLDILIIGRVFCRLATRLKGAILHHLLCTGTLLPARVFTHHCGSVNPGVLGPGGGAGHPKPPQTLPAESGHHKLE